MGYDEERWERHLASLPREKREQYLGKDHTPSSCPWCGLNKKVYVRAGSELVCTDCRREAEVLDAMGNEALIEGGESK